MKAFFAPLAIITILITSFVPVTFAATTEAQGGQVTLKPTDDTYINMDKIDSNYGSSEKLRVCLAHYWTWLKFDLSSVPEGAIEITAVLELYTTYDGVTDPHNVVACIVLNNFNNSWSEATLTCRNMPYQDDLELDTEYVVNNETWYEWVVTEAVVNAIANKTTAVTILMKYPWGMDAPSVSFNSKEASVTKFPKLTISWNDVVPEFSSFAILPIFMIMTLFAVRIYKRKRII